MRKLGIVLKILGVLLLLAGLIGLFTRLMTPTETILSEEEHMDYVKSAFIADHGQIIGSARFFLMQYYVIFLITGVLTLGWAVFKGRDTRKARDAGSKDETKEEKEG